MALRCTNGRLSLLALRARAEPQAALVSRVFVAPSCDGVVRVWRFGLSDSGKAGSTKTHGTYRACVTEDGIGCVCVGTALVDGIGLVRGKGMAQSSRQDGPDAGRENSAGWLRRWPRKLGGDGPDAAEKTRRGWLRRGRKLGRVVETLAEKTRQDGRQGWPRAPRHWGEMARLSWTEKDGRRAELDAESAEKCARMRDMAEARMRDGAETRISDEAEKSARSWTRRGSLRWQRLSSCADNCG
ncbi:hypothetical protein RND71_023354 [Anisodus tanguticus]|uniref:Uncharacterized protein n=1 Tax=Anisodus tanguticus TaxID=243964 RepID=A0AAE1VDP8_9SOLA|nr:hypothetical protein RND71_023354 [Anisodus tanguticus]